MEAALVGLNLKFILLAILCFAAGFGLFLRWSIRQSGSSRRVVLGIVTAVALVVGSSLLTVLTMRKSPVSTNSAPPSPLVSSAAKPPAAPQPLLAEIPYPAEAETSAESRTPSESSKSSLPEWTRATSSATSNRRVISSGRFATREEADQRAIEMAAQAAGEFFRHLDPRGVGVVSPLQAAFVQETAVKQRFEEVREHNFGKFKGSMHQTWLQLEFKPEFGEKLAESWRTLAVDARLRQLTGWGVWLTAVAAVVATALRVDAVWNGRHRVALGLVAALIAIGSLIIA